MSFWPISVAPAGAIKHNTAGDWKSLRSCSLMAMHRLESIMTWLTTAQFAEQMPDAGALLSDEPEMESSLHYQQLALLVSGLEWHWRERRDFFIGANLTVYYSHQQLKHRDFRGPDFFLVTETERRPRPSWVVWEEGGRYPDLIIELLSDSTAAVDRQEKKDLYQRVFRTPEYFWFSPDSLEFAGFRLINNQYRSIRANARRHLWSSVLGMYLGIEPDSGRLRYFDGSGALIPTAEESALQEQARAERLAERLRALGVDPATL
jgi:Uma2 family endonuclease